MQKLSQEYLDNRTDLARKNMVNTLNRIVKPGPTADVLLNAIERYAEALAAAVSNNGDGEDVE